MHKKLRWLVLFLHIIAIVGVVYYWNPWGILWFFAGKWVFANLGIEIGYHRLLSHRSFTTSLWKENILLFLGVFAAYGSPLTWAANHRVHHKNSDKENDPHPSTETVKTFFWYNDPITINPMSIKDLLKKPFVKFLHYNYFKIYFSGLAFFLLTTGPEFTLWFFIMPGAMTLINGAVINIICHRFGYRNFETTDHSRNNWLVNLYSTGGSGWHNNHHKNPGSYTTKVRWWEWDFDGWIIKNILMQTKHA